MFCVSLLFQVLYNTTVGESQISQQLFHLPAHLPIDNFVVGAQTEDIHAGVQVKRPNRQAANLSLA